MTSSPRLLSWIAAASVAAAYLALYAGVFADLFNVWLTQENYSHGLIVAPLIVYLVWRRREVLAAVQPRPSAIGAVLVAVSLLVLLVGTAGVEFFLMRSSAIGVLVGVLLFLGGWPLVKALGFPLALTAFLIPIPPVLFYKIAFPLQLMATKFGVGALELARIPVLREGNVIALTHTTLEVTEACSGIRSLLSLFALAVIYGYFVDCRQVARSVIVLSSIPIAIIANGLRIAGTGIAAHYVGPAAATGFFHTFSGWAVFMTSFVMLVAVANVARSIAWRAPSAQPEPAFR